MKTTITVFFFLALVALMLACHQTQPVQVVIVIDPSASTSNIKNSALGIVEASLSLPGITKRSRILILGTGDKSTAMEPMQLGSYPISRAKKVMEGKDANSKYKAELLQSVSEMLRGVSTTVEVSPIFLAVRRATQYLREQGCSSGPGMSNCHLAVVTDLQETQETAIRNALTDEKDFKPQKNLIIDNTNISITFCGLAATNEITPARNSARAARLEQVWKSLFKVPDQVSFQPFCPQLTKKGDK